MRVGVLSDLHICGRWSPLSALEEVIDQVMGQAPDIILLPGDFLMEKLFMARPVGASEIAACLSRMHAPLGVYASLGNHDWKDCSEAKSNGYTASSVTREFAKAGVPVLSNESTPLGETGAWLVGIDSQQGEGRVWRPSPKHDMKAAFRDVPHGASSILMAHEPDVFLSEPHDAALQVSGHTHGGQVKIGNWRPITPSRYGGRLAHGLHSNADRHLVVSAGLGYSGVPLRLNMPPEVPIVDLAPATE